MKQDYELSYLISDISDEENSQIVSGQISDLIQEKQGLISQDLPTRKILLAYPINKEKEAFLKTCIFNLEREFLPDLEKQIKGNKDVLRYLLVKRIVYKAKPTRRTKPIKPIIAKEQKPTKLPEGTKATKVELEEIGKKLDEILK